LLPGRTRLGKWVHAQQPVWTVPVGVLGHGGPTAGPHTKEERGRLAGPLVGFGPQLREIEKPFPITNLKKTHFEFK
jgi:hypothetical protein